MDQKPKVEVEDLLKLKKFEQPDPEFWEQFDQGLRKKSMEALVQEKRGTWAALWERRWFQQTAVAMAFVFCGVPTYLGVQNLYVENQAEKNRFNMAQNEAVESISSRDLALETTRELARRKSMVDQTRFVVDSYQIDPQGYKLEGDIWQSNSGSESGRTYVNDRVQILSDDSRFLPVNLKY